MHQPHMRLAQGSLMPTEHHVVVSWSGNESESKPLIDVLNRFNYSFSHEVKSGLIQLEIVVESDTMRGLRDAVDELLVQLSSLED